jgi:hypothetical protein
MVGRAFRSDVFRWHDLLEVAIIEGCAARKNVSPQVKQIIRRMAEANATWGAPRIHGELLKLGIDISERSVSRFMPKAEPQDTCRGRYLCHRCPAGRVH